MNNRRVEVTFSVAQWDELEKQRGIASRASFCRRAVDAWLRLGMSPDDPPLAPESVRDEAAEFLQAEQPEVPPPDPNRRRPLAPKKKPSEPPAKKRPLKDLMWERQQRLNEKKP